MKKTVSFWLIVGLCLSFFGCAQSPSGGTVAVVEKFGANWSIKDPSYNYAMDKISRELGTNKVILINYYMDSSDDHPFPRLSCEESMDRFAFYEDTKGIPAVYFNGADPLKGLPRREEGQDSREVCYNALKEKILPINLKSPLVSLKINATRKENGDLEIKVSCSALEDFNYKDLRLMIGITESNIPYVAINGDKIHYFVFREWIQTAELKAKAGHPMILTKAGDKFETTIIYKLNTELYKNELNLFALAQDFETKTILQGVELPLQEQSK